MHQLHARFLLALAKADRSEAQANRDNQVDAKIRAARDALAAANVAWEKRVRHVSDSREKELAELRAAHRQKLK
jgi:hypothetical protein